MSRNHLEDSSLVEGPQEPAKVEWDSIGVGVPVDLVPRIRALARRRGLSVSALGRTLFMAALDAEKAA